jgi:hypothetical protein
VRGGQLFPTIRSSRTRSAKVKRVSKRVRVPTSSPR